MKKLLLILLLAVVASVQAQDADALFESGKEHYKADAFQEAIADWKAILDKGQHSKAVYFNLGNAYYKLGEVAPSIYYYEKALQLDPTDKEVKNNLVFAQNLRIDVIEPLPKTVFTRFYDSTIGSMDSNLWAWLSVGLLMAGVLSFLGYYFSATTVRKRILFVGSLVLFGLMLFSFTAAYLSASDEKNERSAIVFSDTMDVREAPKNSGTVAFQLHAGTKLEIIDQDGDWLRIKLSNGKDGWVSASALKEL